MPISQIRASAMCVIPIFMKVKNRDVRVGWIPAVNTCVWKFIKIYPVETWQRLASWWKDGRVDPAVTLRGAVMRVAQRSHIWYPMLNIVMWLVCCFVKIGLQVLFVVNLYSILHSIIFRNHFSTQDTNLEVGAGNALKSKVFWGVTLYMALGKS